MNNNLNNNFQDIIQINNFEQMNNNFQNNMSNNNYQQMNNNNNFQDISQFNNYQPMNNNIFNNNNFQQMNNNNYNTEINELKRQLAEEKDKNQKLIDKNKILEEKLAFLNNENNKIKELNKQLENNLAQKINELQKILSDKNKNKDYYDLSSLGPNDKVIAVNFVSMGNNDIGHYNLICKNRDLFIRLEERLYNDFPQFKEHETYFEVKGKRIKRFKTLEQNLIKNNDIISMFIIEE